MDEERLEVAAINLALEKRQQKEECDSSGHVAQRSSNRKPLAVLRKVLDGKQKRVSSSRRRLKPTPRGKKSFRHVV